MKSFIQKQTEAGKKVKGARGWIPVSVTCNCKSGCKCSGGSLYIAAEVVEVRMDGCTMKLGVRPVSPPDTLVYFQPLIGKVGKIEQPPLLEVGPTDFFSSTEEIQTLITYETAYKKMREVVKEVENRYGSATQSYRRRKLQELYAKAPAEARAEVDAELEELGTSLAKVSSNHFETFARILATAIFFPEGLPEEEEDEEDDY